jgi:chitodextrinase
MTEILQGDVKVPGLGKTKKLYVFVPAGIAAAFVAWKWYQASQDSAPASGADGYYSTDQSELGLSTTGGATNVSGNTGNTETDGTQPDSIDTNAEWTNKAVELLANAGYDPAVVYAALGEFLGRRALDKTEASIARAALAAAGQPPEGRPWTVLEEATTGGTGTPAAPTGLKVTSTTASSVSLSWSAVAGAGSYQVYRDGSSVGSATSTSYTSSGLKAATPYKFAVLAVGTTGKSGPKSGEVSAKTSAAPATSTPKPSTGSKVPSHYTVIARPGDSISKIAARYHQSWQKVWDFNLKYRDAKTAKTMKDRGPDKIFAGTRIWVQK